MKKKLIIGFVVILFITTTLTAFKSAPSDCTANQKLQDSTLLNVVYGNNINADGKNQKLTMDLYFPPNALEGRRYPLVLLMHGGSFVSGSKENMASSCKQLADSGFIAVTINYRKGWNALSRLKGCDSVDINGLILANYRALQDAHAALRFLAGNAVKYKIDADWIFIGGSSAGGVNALNVVYLDEKYAEKNFVDAVSKLGKINNATNDYVNEFKIKGICNMWGALPDSNLVTKKNAVPTIFYHGTADVVVPYDKGSYIPGCDKMAELYGSACIYRQTLAAKQPAVLNTSIGGKHGPLEFTRAIMMSNVASFFHHVMLGKAKSASYTNAIAGSR